MGYVEICYDSIPQFTYREEFVIIGASKILVTNLFCGSSCYSAYTSAEPMYVY